MTPEWLWWYAAENFKGPLILPWRDKQKGKRSFEEDQYGKVIDREVWRWKQRSKLEIAKFQFRTMQTLFGLLLNVIVVNRVDPMVVIELP